MGMIDRLIKDVGMGGYLKSREKNDQMRRRVVVARRVRK